MRQLLYCLQSSPCSSLLRTGLLIDLDMTVISFDQGSIASAKTFIPKWNSSFVVFALTVNVKETLAKESFVDHSNSDTDDTASNSTASSSGYLASEDGSLDDHTNNQDLLGKSYFKETSWILKFAAEWIKKI